MSLGLEPTESDVMTRKPRDPRMGVVSPASILFVPFSKDRKIVNSNGEIDSYVRSETFAVLTISQFFLAFTCRSLRQSIVSTGVMGNLYMVVAVLSSLILLLIGHYVPGLNDLLQLEPLQPLFYAKASISVVVVVLASEIVKFLTVKFLPKY
jgi:Ca2+-transporting ATPase